MEKESSQNYTLMAEEKTDKRIYMSVFLLGIGILLPWNAILTAFDFLNLRFPDQKVSFYAPVSFFIMSLLGQFIIIRFGDLVSLTKRIIYSFIVTAVLLVAIPILCMPDLISTNGAFWSLMALVFVLGGASACLQTSCFGLCGALPGLYMQSFMSGQGMAGLAICFCRILTKICFKEDLHSQFYGSLVYFGLAGVFILVCVTSYWYMKDLPLIQAAMHQTESANTADDDKESLIKLKVAVVSEDASTNEPATLFASTASEPVCQEKPITNVAVLKMIWVYCALVCFNFVVTLCLFPGVTYALKSTVLKNGWLGVLLVTCFNLFDVLGRAAPGFFMLFNRMGLVAPVLLRALFIPLFIALAVHTESAFLGSLAVQFVVQAVFAFSSGYLSTALMMQAPETVEPKLRERAGFLMSLFLSIGLCAGVHSALLVSLAI